MSNTNHYLLLLKWLNQVVIFALFCFVFDFLFLFMLVIIHVLC